MAQQQILAQEDARIGLQSTGGGRQMLRSRIPTEMFTVLQAQDGEYFHWTVFTDMQAAVAHIPEGVGVVVGYIIPETDAKPRNVIAEKQADAKKSAKKGASKKGVVKLAPKAAPVDDDPFGEEEDDGSAPPKRRVVVATPKKQAPTVVARKPVAASVVRAPIAKPGVTRKGRKVVRYRE